MVRGTRNTAGAKRTNDNLVPGGDANSSNGMIKTVISEDTEHDINE